MKASELITLLQDAIDKYGDLPVTNEFSPGLDSDFELFILDDEGLEVEEDKGAGQPIEFYLECT